MIARCVGDMERARGTCEEEENKAEGGEWRTWRPMANMAGMADMAAANGGKSGGLERAKGADGVSLEQWRELCTCEVPQREHRQRSADTLCALCVRWQGSRIVAASGVFMFETHSSPALTVNIL